MTIPTVYYFCFSKRLLTRLSELGDLSGIANMLEEIVNIPCAGIFFGESPVIAVFYYKQSA